MFEMRLLFIVITLIFVYPCINGQEGHKVDDTEKHIKAVEKRITAITNKTDNLHKQLGIIKSYQSQTADTLITQNNINQAMLDACMDTLRQLDAGLAQLEENTLAHVSSINNEIRLFKKHSLIFVAGLVFLLFALFFITIKIIKKQALITHKHIMSLSDQNLSSAESLHSELSSKTTGIRVALRKDGKETRKFIKKKK